MTADNPNQGARTAELRGMIDARLAELDETLRLRREKGFDEARKVVLADRGKDQRDEIRRMVDALQERFRLFREAACGLTAP